MPASTGYSGVPLVKKLGLKPGMFCFLQRPPEHYVDLIAPLPNECIFLKSAKPPVDFIHLFVKRYVDLQTDVAALRPKLAETGMLWVSWPKKSSGVSTDVTEDSIREVAFQHDLVDIKVCAVDQTWSALKLVIRVALRKS